MVRRTNETGEAGFTSVTALDTQSGAQLWQTTIAGGNVGGRPYADASIVVFGTLTNAPLTAALDAASGAVLWSTPGVSESQTADAERVYVGDGKGLRALDRETGGELWAVPYGPGNVLSRTPLPYNGRVFNPTEAGLVVHDAETGEILHRAPSPDGSGWKSGSFGHGRMYVQTGRATYAVEGLELPED